MDKIIIDGNIGSGKSTVLNSLSEHFTNFKIVLEDLESWMPYLEQFYSNMEKHSLCFQMKVLEHHMKNRDLSKCVLERSPLSCIYVFGLNLLENSYISKLDYKLMQSYNDSFGWIPKTVIYIKTNPIICQQRVLERHRDGETIPIEYLNDIDNLYNDLYFSGSKRLDSNENMSIGTIYYKETDKFKVYIVDGNQSKDLVKNDVEWLIKNYI